MPNNNIDVNAITSKLKGKGWDDAKITSYLTAKGVYAPEVVEKAPTQQTDAGIIKEFSNSVYNGFVPELSKAVVEIPNLVAGAAGYDGLEHVTNKSVDWINNNLKAYVAPEHQQGIFKINDSNEIELTDARSFVNGLGQGVGSMLSFLVPGTALAKGAKMTATAATLLSGTLISAPMLYESGRRAGLSNTDNARMTLLLAPIIGALELVGGLETSTLNKVAGRELEQAATKDLTEATLQGVIQKAAGAGIKNADDFALAAKESVFGIKNLMRRALNPTVAKNAAGEATEEYLQNLVQKTGEQMYDTLYADPNAKQGEGKYGTELVVPADEAAQRGLWGTRYNKKEFIDDFGAAIYGGIIGHGMSSITTPVVNQSLYGYLDVAARTGKLPAAMQSIGGVVQEMGKAGKINQQQAQNIGQVTQQMAQVAQTFAGTDEQVMSPAARYGAYDMQFNVRPGFEGMIASYDQEKQKLADLIQNDPRNTIAITAQQKVLADNYSKYKQAQNSVVAINNNIRQLTATGEVKSIKPTLEAISGVKHDIATDEELKPLMQGYGQSNNANTTQVGNEQTQTSTETTAGGSGQNNEGTKPAGTATIGQLIGFPLAVNGHTGTISKNTDGEFEFQPEDGTDPVPMGKDDVVASSIGIAYDENLLTAKNNQNAVREQTTTEGVLRDKGLRGEGELPGVGKEDQPTNIAQQSEENGPSDQISPEAQALMNEKPEQENLGATAEDAMLLPPSELEQRKKETVEAAGPDDVYVKEIDNAQEGKKIVDNAINTETQTLLAGDENRQEAADIYGIGVLVELQGNNGAAENTGVDKGAAAEQPGGGEQNSGKPGENTDENASTKQQAGEDTGAKASESKTVKAAPATIPAPSNLQPKWDKAREDGQYTEDTHTYVRNPVATNLLLGSEGTSNFSDQAKRVPFRYALVVLDEVQPTQKGVRTNPRNFIPESQPKPISEARDLDNQTRAKEDNFENSYIGVSGSDPFSGMVNVNERLEVFQGTGRWNILNYHENQEARTQFLKEQAAITGITPEQIDEFVGANEGKKIDVVKVYNVTDDQAIRLGQYAVTDKESTPQGTRENQLAGKVKPETVAKIREILVQAAKAGLTGAELFRSKADAILKALQADGVLGATEYSAYFDEQGNVKPSGVEDIQEIMVRVAYPNNGQLVGNLPDKAKRGIAKSVPLVIGVSQDKTIAPNIDRAIGAYREFVSETKGASTVDDWFAAVDNTRGTQKGAALTNLEKELVRLFATGSENQIAGVFNNYFEQTNGKSDIFGTVEPRSREDAVKEVFGVDYQSHVVQGGKQIARNQTALDDVRARREAIMAKLKAKGESKNLLLMLGSNFDPEQLGLMIELGANYAEEGLIRFSDWAKQMLRDGYGSMKEYFVPAYEALRNTDLSVEIKNGLSKSEEVQAVDIDNLEKQLQNEEARNTAITEAAARRQAQLGSLGVQSVPVVNRTDVAEGLNARPNLRYAYASIIPSVRDSITAQQYPFIDDHQRFAVNSILQAFKSGQPAFMLGDGTGVGKTAEELITAHEIALQTGQPVLIVVPNEKIIDTRFKVDIAKINSQAPLQPINPSRFEFTTYAKLSTKTGTKYAAVIFDEADALSGIDSKRNAAFKQMQTNFVVFATATPFETPMQSLYALSRMLGQSDDEVANSLDFNLITKQDRGGNDYTDMQIPSGMTKEQFFQQYKGAIDALTREFVAGGTMLRRAYPFYGDSQNVDVTNASPLQYSTWRSNIFENYTNWIRSIFKDIKAGRISEGEGNKKIEFVGGERMRNTEYLTETEKAPFIAQDIVRQIAAGQSIVVATEFKGKVDPVTGKEYMDIEGIRPPGFENKDKPNTAKIPTSLQIIKDHLDKKGITYGEITGNVSDAKAKKAINEFQANKTKVVLLTKSSGATGIDLDDQVGNAPRSLYVVSEGWSAKELQQLLGRVSRRNTKSPASVYFIKIPGSLSEQRYDQISAIKRNILTAAQDGEMEQEAPRQQLPAGRAQVSAKVVPLQNVRENNDQGFRGRELLDEREYGYRREGPLPNLQSPIATGTTLGQAVSSTTFYGPTEEGLSVTYGVPKEHLGYHYPYVKTYSDNTWEFIPQAQYEAARSEWLNSFDHAEYEQWRRSQQTTVEIAPISQDTANYIQATLTKAFPKVDVQILTKDNYEKQFGTTTNAHIGVNGIVYLNSAKINSSTQVHEFGHVWSSWAKRYASALYQQGIQLTMEDTALMDRVAAANPTLKGEALSEEALATMIGEKGGMTVENMANAEQAVPDVSLVQFFNNLWNKLKNFIYRTVGIKQDDNWQTQTIGEFAAKVSQQLLSGQQISDLTSDEIAAIESDLNIPRAQVTYKDTYDKDYLRSTAQPQQIFKPSYIDTQAALKTNISAGLNAMVAGIVANDPNYTLGDFMNSDKGLTFAKNYFGKMLNSVISKIEDRGFITGKADENPMNKAEDKELKDTIAAMNQGSYDAQLKQLTGLIFTNKLSPANMSSDVARLWSNLTRFSMREQYLAANGDSLFLNDTDKVDVEDASLPFRANVDVWLGKLKRYRDNKYLKPVVEVLEKYIRNVANMRLWAQMQSGEKEGILWELYKGMHRGVGKKDYVRTVAGSSLSPLFGASWLKDGSQTLNYNAKLADLDTEDYQGVPLTTEEQFNIFMMLQQDRVRGALFGTPAAPKQAKFYVEEFKDERAGQVVKLEYSDYQKLLAKFDPHWDEVKDSWGVASDYVFGEVQDAFEKENGVKLGSSVQTAPNQRWNLYYPLVHGEGSDAIRSFLKSNSFVNDIKSQKVRQPSNDVTYYGSGGIRIMEGYVDDNAQYIGFAIPVRNMNLFFRHNEEWYKENGLQNYVEWWNETREYMFNPDESILGSMEQKVLQGFVVSRLGLNPFVFLKQFTSVPLASTVIPSKYLIGATQDLFGSLAADVKNYDVFSDWIGKAKVPIELQEEMKTHSPYALSRLNHGVNEMEKYVRAHENQFTALFHKFTGKNLKMDDLMKLIRTADAATGVMIWSAAKKYVEQEMGLRPGSDEYWRAVDDKYTEAVIESQSSVDDVNRPLFPKRNKLINKALSLFGGQAMSNFNAFNGRMIEWLSHPNPKNQRKLAHSFMNVFVMNALIVAAVDTVRASLFGAGGGGDDKDIYSQAFLRASYQNLPIISPVLDAVVTKYQSPIFGRDFSHPIFEIINGGTEAVANAMRGNETKAAKEMMYFASGVYGVPVTPLRATEELLK